MSNRRSLARSTIDGILGVFVGVVGITIDVDGGPG